MINIYPERISLKLDEEGKITVSSTLVDVHACLSFTN